MLLFYYYGPEDLSDTHHLKAYIVHSSTYQIEICFKSYKQCFWRGEDSSRLQGLLKFWVVSCPVDMWGLRLFFLFMNFPPLSMHTHAYSVQSHSVVMCCEEMCCFCNLFLEHPKVCTCGFRLIKLKRKSAHF